MDERALFTRFWENESKTTRKVIARIPEGSAYRPDAKSRTASEIAWQIVCEEKMIIEALETGSAEWKPPPRRQRSRSCSTSMRRKVRISSGGGKRCPTRAGTVRWRSSAVSDRRRRWRGASFSTSCTIEGRFLLTFGQWDRPSRRSTDQAGTSLSRRVDLVLSYVIIGNVTETRIRR